MTLTDMLFNALTGRERPAELPPFMATEAERNNARVQVYQQRLAASQAPETMPTTLAARGSKGLQAIAKLQAYWAARKNPRRRASHKATNVVSIERKRAGGAK